MSSVSARTSAAVLRRQAMAMHVAVPLFFAGLGLGSAFWVTTSIAFFAAAFGAIFGFAIGVWLAQRLEAAATALDCQVEIAELLRSATTQLTTLLASHQAQTLEALRVLALNTDALTRVESVERPANVNQG